MPSDGDSSPRRSLDALGRELAALRARLDVVIDALAAQGILSPGHQRLIEREAAGAAATAPRAPVQLRVIDKYQIAGPDIDCASRLPLCQARCCSFEVTLSEQDLDEGGLAWEWRAPYLLRRERDGYCTHYQRDGGTCGVHERRPAECRVYDCRTDPRVWLDFDARIPATRSATGDRSPAPAAHGQEDADE